MNNKMESLMDSKVEVLVLLKEMMTTANNCMHTSRYVGR